MEKLYEAEVTTTAGRNGHSKSSDGMLDVDVKFPKELGGPGDATNPEQLFGAAWSACFGTSIAAVAGNKNVKIGQVTVTAKIAVYVKDGGHVLGAHLLAKIEGVTNEVAKELVDAAKSVCGYSKATHGNIETVYEVVS